MIKSSSGTKAKAPNERLRRNLATVTAPNDSDNKISTTVWQILVDKITGIKFTGFYDKKSSIADKMCERLVQLETMAGKPVQYCEDTRTLDARTHGMVVV